MCTSSAVLLCVLLILTIFQHTNIFNTQQDEPVFWKQLGQVLPGGDSSDPSIGENFGSAVATSRDGRTIIVSGVGRTNADGDRNAGYAKVFRYDEGTALWGLLGDGPICGDDAGDQFGEAVAISGDGNVVAIGASWADTQAGEVRVFRLMTDAWEPMGSPFNGNSTYDESGYSVSLSNGGDILAIGAVSKNIGAR